MTYQEFDKWLIEQAQSMPHARGDRSAQQTAQNAATTAQGTAAGYGSQASGIYGPLTSFATGEMNAPPGYGTALPGMESQAAQAGTSASNDAAEQARLQATRTGNAAGLSANEDAIAQKAAQGTGANVQNILGQNAQLMQQQRQQGSQLLQGIYGTDVSAQNAAAGQVPNDVNADVNAGKSGWLQNLTGVLGTLGNLGLGSAGLALGQGTGGKCWVAAELYGGWERPEVYALRRWIFGTWWMKPFALFYQFAGGSWSELISRDAEARRITRKLFDWMLRRANG